jgi:hypothetical protein
MSDLDRLIGIIEQLPAEKRAELERLAISMLRVDAGTPFRPDVQKAFDRTVAKFGPALDELSK